MIQESDANDVNVLPMTDTDAALIVAYATNVYIAVCDEELPPEYREGITLMYEALVSGRVKALLPKRPELAHIFTMIDQVERLVRLIRQSLDLPPRLS